MSLMRMAIVTSSIASVAPTSPPTWQESMRMAVRSPAELCRLLGLGPEWDFSEDAPQQAFPLFVPREYLARMEWGNPHDPLLRQVLPLGDESLQETGFSLDPVGDTAATLSPGVLHKYSGRALLIATGACAIHCRYCFRRHYPYEESPHSLAQWEPSLAAIAADSSLHEVILSGGDPLTLPDAKLAQLLERIEQIPHVSRLRIHTRLPIVIPQRITDGLLTMLGQSRLQTIVVVHANHAAELDAPTAAALSTLVEAGLLVFNQAVLLRGVNDSAALLAELCLRLIELRVVPYYLHQLDRVTGAAHFEVPLEEGLAIVEQLRTLLPGYAMPQYVQEIPGEASKTPLWR